MIPAPRAERSREGVRITALFALTGLEEILTRPRPLPTLGGPAPVGIRGGHDAETSDVPDHL
jgi:hypothetical protein